MNKIEIKHVAAYLPYKVKIQRNGILRILYGASIDDLFFERDEYPKNIMRVSYEYCKLVLRPLSELTAAILTDRIGIDISEARAFINFAKCGGIMNIADFCDYDQVQKLISEHYDVFNLISQGAAININTLEKE